MAYVPQHIENWNSIEHECRYRASMSGNKGFKFHPSDDIVDACRVSPGGRILLAFRLKEVRDYFVAGYLDCSAQAEEDFATRATKYIQPEKRKEQEVADFDVQCERYMIAKKADIAAQDHIEKLFLTEVRSLCSEGKTTEAIAVARSIHGDCVVATLAQSAIFDAKHDYKTTPYHSVDPVPLSAERALALTQWMHTHERAKEEEELMGKSVPDRIQVLLDTKGREAAGTWAESLPPSLVKVFALDQARYGKISEPADNINAL